MKIAILNDDPDEVRKLHCFQLLADHDVIILSDSDTNEMELAGYLSGVEALVLIREQTRITASLLSLLPDLRVIVLAAKLSGHIDPALCARHGVKVIKGTGTPVAPAELTWSLILAASSNQNNAVTEFRFGNWQQSGIVSAERNLKGRNLGIWGYGKIGQRIARYAHTGGMNVTVWGRRASRKLACEQGFKAAASKADFFSQVDIMTLHLRLNSVTRHCVTKEDLALMKPDSLLVNTSRAELIEPDAVYNEMRLNASRNATGDIYQIEPATPDNCKILSQPNVLCSPHIGYIEKSSSELYFRSAFESLVQFANKV